MVSLQIRFLQLRKSIRVWKLGNYTQIKVLHKLAEVRAPFNGLCRKAVDVVDANGCA